jgi:hypothetical protein
VSSSNTNFVVVTDETLCVVETPGVVTVKVGLGAVLAWMPGWTVVLSHPAEVQTV